MQRNRLLIIEDDQYLRRCIAVYFRDNDFDVIEAGDGVEGLERFHRQKPDLVLTDLRMPELDGFAVIAEIVEKSPATPVIVISGSSEIRDAIRAMRMGARDYIIKPIYVFEELKMNVSRALKEASMMREVESLRDKLLSGKLKNPQAFSAITTRNPAMLSLFQYLEVISATSQPILITGETGTGKELIARAVHAVSGYRGEMVSVNVAGLDDNMFCDTLFGHVKGAFTGADHVRGGLIAKAEGGTLFLDEIGDLSEASQVRLLRLIQEGEYFPAGSDVVRKTNCRIIAATHRDLRGMVDRDEFRQDLYYRLYAYQVKVPSLSERVDDIPLLLEQFIAEASLELNKKKPTPPRELFAYLASYRFPGNVRELRAMTFDAVAHHTAGMLSMETFLGAIGQPVPTVSLPSEDAVIILRDSDGEHVPTLKQAEAVLIAQALKAANGNQGVAATYLGINRSALNKKLLKQRKSLHD